MMYVVYDKFYGDYDYVPGEKIHELGYDDENRYSIHRDSYEDYDEDYED